MTKVIRFFCANRSLESLLSKRPICTKIRALALAFTLVRAPRRAERDVQRSAATAQIPLSERSDEIPERNTSESDSRAVFNAVRSVKVVGTHSQAEEHLASLELRQVVAHTDTLETAADILDKTSLLEGVKT